MSLLYRLIWFVYNIKKCGTQPLKLLEFFKNRLKHNCNKLRVSIRYRPSSVSDCFYSFLLFAEINLTLKNSTGNVFMEYLFHIFIYEESKKFNFLLLFLLFLLSFCLFVLTMRISYLDICHNTNAFQ